MLDSQWNIVLTGFMGTGKSAVGRILSERLGRPLLDADDVLEQETGRTVPQIFSEEGEEGFRELEKKVVQKLASAQAQVITTGGGAVLDPENRAALEAAGILICLRAQPETILARIEMEAHRPLIEGGDRLKKIQELLSARAGIYDQIPHQVDTDGQTPLQVAKKIETLLANL
jgi:shikimate kinase